MKLCISLLFVFAAVVVPVYADAMQVVVFEGKRVWSRNEGAIQVIGDVGDTGGARIVHTGKLDWSLFDGERIAVQCGDRFTLSANMRCESANNSDGHAGISVVTRNAAGDVISWDYAHAAATRGSNGSGGNVRSTFIVPPNVATIEPRIIGNGPATVDAVAFTITKTGTYEIPVTPVVERHSTATLDFAITFPSGEIALTDKRTQRTWRTTTNTFFAAPKSAPEQPFTFSLVNCETAQEINVQIVLDANSIAFEITGDGAMSSRGVAYPPPFKSEAGDRLIVPVNEGVGYPVEMKEIGVRRLIAYGGHGICMPFWGQISDANGAGYVAILETPDDAAIDIVPNVADEVNEKLTVGCVWEASLGAWRYPRRVKFTFLDGGGHVAVCKEYRKYAQQTGLVKTFTEKVKERPQIDMLLGAANIWFWGDKGYSGGNRMTVVHEMKKLGMDRLLWSSGGSAEELEELNKLGGVLTSRYDIYQDAMDPAQFANVAYVHGDWTSDAWPHDINWTAPNGEWRRGWEVEAKDTTKPRIACGVICDAKAVPYAVKRIGDELKTKPYKARFIDTTVAAPWFECYNPDHPMTRTDSKNYKMKLLQTVCDFGLVCGSETGHDASVPFCDFFEGMLSLGPYRIDEAGRNMLELVDDIPPNIEKFQVNPALRLPLWELVYHDCVVAQWYWGDYNNKLPKVWRERDLFNALYGTPPMYMFTFDFWEKNKERFAESYRTATTVARATAYAEMTDHHILSPDRLVQQSEFSNGVRVTVNFGDKTFRCDDGTEIAPHEWCVVNETK
ncbi:MAG: glycoside hydrolase [Thermoguttaceae bacterium]